MSIQRHSDDSERRSRHNEDDDATILPFESEQEDTSEEDGELDYAEPPREPLYPTGEIPGSNAKKKVMRKRIRSGESPFHHLDRKLQEEEDEWRRRVKNAGLPFAPSKKGVNNG